MTSSIAEQLYQNGVMIFHSNFEKQLEMFALKPEVIIQKL